MSAQTIGSRPDLQDCACIFSCRTGFKPDQKETDYPYSILVTLASMRLACQAGPYCSSECSQLCRTTGDFSPPAGYGSPSNITETSHQGRSFLASANLISPRPVTRVYGAFSNGVWPSSSGGQPRAMTIAYIILEVFSTSLTDNSGEDIFHLTLTFCLATFQRSFEDDGL